MRERARAPARLYVMANRLDLVQRYDKLEEFLTDQPNSNGSPYSLKRVDTLDV